MKLREKKPWPTKAVMQQIYEKNLWGKGESLFFSGDGSHNKAIVNPYLEAVQHFLKSFTKPISVLDLGCGDFNIGKELLPFSKHYCAIDIVDDLIAHNKNMFKANDLEFYCLDASKDDLPHADCVIVRQVFQHLSNSEITQILKKLKAYKYIILTEHLPIGNFTPNIDMIADRGNRLNKNSGVDILESPFNFKAKKTECLIRYELEDNNSVIETKLFYL